MSPVFSDVVVSIRPGLTEFSFRSDFYLAPSGNITLHCETALDALRSFAPEYPRFHLDTTKARLVLMTAEPDALEKIASEPICQRHFEIVPFPRGGTDKPYKQADFYELSEATRLEDTQRFLAEADVLANYVDATVVSGNSNTGRLIFTRGGPTRAIDEFRIRSVDVPWHVRLPHRNELATCADDSLPHCTANAVCAVRRVLRWHSRPLLPRVKTQPTSGSDAKHVIMDFDSHEYGKVE